MRKVYPDATTTVGSRIEAIDAAPEKAKASVSGAAACGGGDVELLTVWKKSLLLNCKGFTVYDGKGNLVFRVDNYVAASKAEIVLMDAAGKPLLTIRRKRLSLGECWQVYHGEMTTNPIFSVHRPVNFLNSKTLALVTTSANNNGGGTPPSSPNSKNIVYEIVGSYSQRNVAVYDNKRRCVAEIRRKESAIGGVQFGGDVFRLIVHPYIDTPMAMALVILLDQMFGSSLRLPV
ncbi:hypothetical protein Ancab_004817 [Ancistrocladus abbreviatus]